MAASEVLSRKNLILPVFIVIVILSVSAAGYFFYQYQKTQSLLKNPSVATANEVKQLVAKDGALIELPKNEDPTVATV